jgi:PadR family transcriptional regulator, regulatory protein PadR
MRIPKESIVDFIELHILHHAGEEPIYGLWMIEELRHHGYAVGASHLYPKLHKMEKLGYLKRTEKLVDGKRRKYYTATAKGRRYLQMRKRMVLELVWEAFSPEELLSPERRRSSSDTHTRKG